MKKKFLFIIACIWLIICFFIIKYTYAKYLSTIDSNANIRIDQWKLVLNNQDITSNSDFSQNLNLIFPGSQYYIEDCIVPGSIGYFDLNIDSSNVSLPFRYTVTLGVDDDNEIDDVKIIGYSYPGIIENITYINNSSNQIVSTCNKDVTSTVVRVYISWNDDNTATLNDAQDTAIALSSGTAVINANVLFEQI